MSAYIMVGVNCQKIQRGRNTYENDHSSHGAERIKFNKAT